VTPGSIKKGTVIDGYEVIDILGRGGMGAVFRVRRGDAEYALKVLALASGEDTSEEVVRFQREAELLASLRHKGIVRVVTASHKTGFFYFIMRLVEGESLEARIKRSGALPPAEAVKLLLQVADAVAHAHEKGIVHRDLKPSNILLERETGLALVTDFGLARRLGESDRERLTVTGEILGTPAYVAPEQALGLKQELDEKTDVYGLGALLYALLAGHAPFDGSNALATMKKVVTEAPLPIKNVAPELEAFVIARAMAKDRAARPPTARAFMEELAATSGSPLAISKRAWALLGLGVVASAAFVLTALVLRDQRLPPKPEGDIIKITSKTETRAPRPEPGSELLCAYLAALSLPTLSDRASALRALREAPRDEAVREQAASILMEDACARQEQIHASFPTRGSFGPLLLDPVRIEEYRNELARAFRSFARWYKLTREPDLMPDRLDYAFRLLDELSRNPDYASLRGTGWASSWEQAFAELPEHPTICFLRACVVSQGRIDDPRAGTALTQAEKAWQGLSGMAHHSQSARFLAYGFVKEIPAVRERLDLVTELLEYANYKGTGLPLDRGDPLPPPIIPPE
jgi:serine/threonine protein kinase